MVLGSLFCVLVGCVDTDDVRSSVVFDPNQDVNTPSATQGEVAVQTNEDGVYVIRNHRGGQIIAVEAERRRLLNWGGPVRIEGFCNSACAILATLPNACLTPRSRIGFHSANINFGPVGNAQVARYLRGGVKEKFLSEWQFVPHSDIHHIWGETFVSLDPEARLCE